MNVKEYLSFVKMWYESGVSSTSEVYRYIFELTNMSIDVIYFKVDLIQYNLKTYFKCNC